MRKFLHILALAAICCACAPSITVSDNVCTFVRDGVRYNVGFMSENTVHIQAFPEGDTLVTRRLVTDAGPCGCFRLRETRDEIIFRTSSISVIFDKPSSRFSFEETGTGRLILKEASRSFTPSEAGGEPCLQVSQSFLLSDDEALYGLGQYQDGILNYRGHEVLMTQSNMDIVNPFLVSTGGYGLLWDNYSSTVFRDGKDGCSFTSEVGDASDYYFIHGADMDEVVSGYRELTGRVPMFGKWVYGFWQSKERYKSFDELEAVVREYRRRQVPIDNIVQDWEYWGDKPHWNALEFHPDNFPDPEKHIDELHSVYNVHLMLSVWPGFGPETEIYHDLDSIGALFDEPTWAGYKVFDAYNPHAREIFWNHFKTGLYDKGVDAWWMDATEPSFRDGFTRRKQEERTKSAGQTFIGSFHRYLNTYSLEMMKDLYGRLRSADEEKRVFIFTRSAFASQQRYATAVWSGDVSASWENMHRQLVAGLNLSVSGIPYWTSDTGGFYVFGRDGRYPDGLQSEEYKELYGRWFQFGAFTPVFRAHGTDVPREIWQFGEPGTIYYDNQLKYIRLRYSLLPYIYSVSYMVTSENYTMLRPLAMDFTSDGKTHDEDCAYMFGPSLLVRPVFSPASEERSVSTYLPWHEGGFWFDFATGEALRCGEEHIRPNVLDELPLYVKAGSIIPLAEIKQWTTEYPDTSLELRVYGGADASFLWYDDEGDSYRYEEGFCSRVPVEWDDRARTLTIGRRRGSYNGMPASVMFRIKVILPSGEILERDATYHGNKVRIKF